jgi:hypothetical protein
MVVGTERVTVCQQDSLAVQVSDDRIRKQPAASSAAEIPSDQEIPIPVQYEAADAIRRERPQALANARLGWIRIIVAYPYLEQIAQDVQRFSIRSLCPQEMEELLHRLRRGSVEMQIGYEQPGHCNTWKCRSYFGDRMVS